MFCFEGPRVLAMALIPQRVEGFFLEGPEILPVLPMYWARKEIFLEGPGVLAMPQIPRGVEEKTFFGRSGGIGVPPISRRVKNNFFLNVGDIGGVVILWSIEKNIFEGLEGMGNNFV